MRDRIVRNRIIRALLFALLLGLDILTKYLVEQHLRGQPDMPLIDGVLELAYTRNTGASFNFLAGNNGLLLCLGIAIFCVLAYCYFRIPTAKKWNKLKYAGTVVLAGALGNLIDRVCYGYVVDFIYFKPIDFPKFNLADSCLVVGLLACLILICFVYKGEDIAEIRWLPGKARGRQAPGDT